MDKIQRSQLETYFVESVCKRWTVERCSGDGKKKGAELCYQQLLPCIGEMVWQPEGWLLISLDPRKPQHTPGAYPRHPQRPKWKEFRNINRWLGVWGYVPGGMLKNYWIGGIYVYIIYYCKPIAKAIGVMAFAILSGDLPFQAPKSWRCWGQSQGSKKSSVF